MYVHTITMFSLASCQVTIWESQYVDDVDGVDDVDDHHNDHIKAWHNCRIGRPSVSVGRPPPIGLSLLCQHQ